MKRWRAQMMILAGAAWLASTPLWGATLADRLQDEKYLTALRRDSRRLSRAAQPSEQSGDFMDVRCVMHAHSGLSHDSRGTEADLVAAAKATGTRAVFMTEHPTPDRKWESDGLRGMKEGVLFVPGAELSDGLLVWRGKDAAWTPGMKAGEVLRALNGTDGVAFIAHPEQRKEDADWDLPAFAGMEIYNTHADAMDSGYEKALEDLKKENPLKLLQMLNTVKKFQQEAFATIWDEPSGNLKRWDALNQQFLAQGRRVIGIAANDSHQNVGVTFEFGDDVVIKDALGKVVGTVPSKKVPLFLLGGLGSNGPLTYTFDPYEVSFRYVGTHVLATEVTEPALFEALQRGRAYVSFDWIANPGGFRYFASTPGGTVEMGDTVKAGVRPVLTVRPNMPCEIRLIRDGAQVASTEGAELTYEVKEPGVYRAECRVRVADEPRTWIYSNPIYVVPDAPAAN